MLEFLKNVGRTLIKDRTPRLTSLNIFWFRVIAFIVCGIFYTILPYFIVIDSTEIRLPTESQIVRQELNKVNTKLHESYESLQVLNLSTEFGFDPTITYVVLSESKEHFGKGDNPLMWRFIRNEIDLAYAILSIIKVESNGNRYAVSSADACGLTQLLPSTASDYREGTTCENLFSIQTNIEIATQHFVYLLDLFNGNEARVYDAYNRGQGTVLSLLRRGQSPANGYARRVFESAALNVSNYRIEE